MTIHKDDPRLTAYALGELPSDEVAQVEAFLESSSEARDVVAQVRKQAHELRAGFVAEGIPPARPRAFGKYIVWMGGIVVLVFLVWAFLPSPNVGVEEVDHRAKMILNPPAPPVEVNGEFAISVDVEGKEAQIGSDLDAILVKSVFEAHANEIRKCYESVRPAVGDGSIVFEWDVTPDGRATKTISSNNALKSDALASCIGARLRSWSFPKPVGVSARVVYPVRFYH